MQIRSDRVGSEIASHVAIYVMSSDKTSDVAFHFCKGFSKYWSDCPFTVYFGVNAKSWHTEEIHATPLKVPIRGWKHESLDQLRIIKNKAPNLTHLIVFLDDFIISDRVNSELIKWAAKKSLELGLKYLRLRRLESSFAWKILNYRGRENAEKILEINRNYPYYSSLQVAIWEIEHLKETIQKSHDIWHFETLNIPNYAHYATNETAIKYQHIVEKGKWVSGAEEYCKSAIDWFDCGSRPVIRYTKLQQIKNSLGKMIFPIFGYTFLRIRILWPTWPRRQH
jgi:hypothetical protein